jgi:hypothetical protein
LLDSSQIFAPTVIINSFICAGTYAIFDTPSAWPAVLAEGGLRERFWRPTFAQSCAEKFFVVGQCPAARISWDFLGGEILSCAGLLVGGSFLLRSDADSQLNVFGILRDDVYVDGWGFAQEAMND